LYLAIANQTSKKAFFYGWIYGLALGLFSFSWLAEVMGGYGGLGTGGGVVLVLLAAYLALYQGLWAYLMGPWLLNTANPYLVPILGGALWTGLDWLKNFVFTGFNWTPLAVGLAAEPEMMGAADLLGLYGLALPVAAISGWLFFMVKNRVKARPLLGFILGTLVYFCGYGSLTYKTWEKEVASGYGLKIAVLQASVEQSMKWNVNYRDLILDRYSLLVAKAELEKPWLIVWSETAAPFSYGHDPIETAWLDNLLANSTAHSLVGVTRLEPKDGVYRLYNRAWLMGPNGPGPYYDKRHLVPFGEYVPLAKELPFLRWAFFQGVLGAAGRFSPGEKGAPLDHGGFRLGLMICFESTFPYLARDRVLEGANLLVVTTNDAWFGTSWAPEQHLNQAAWRAVENRRPLVRAANNGISANVSPSGRILARSAQNEINAYIYAVPILRREVFKLTIYARFGHYLPPILAILTIIYLLYRFSKTIKFKNIKSKIDSSLKNTNLYPYNN
jgi:apolipoprotein N-acyltransferase